MKKYAYKILMPEQYDGRKKLMAKDIENMRCDREEGMTYSELGKKYNVTSVTTCYHCNKDYNKYTRELTQIIVDIDNKGVHHNLFAKDNGMARFEAVYVPKGFKTDDDMLFNEGKEETVSRIMENIEDLLGENKRSVFYREWKGLSNWQKVQKIIMRNTSVAGNTASTKYCCRLGLAPDRYSVYSKLEVTDGHVVLAECHAPI